MKLNAIIPVAFIVCLFAGQAVAAEKAAFTPAAFDAAEKAGKLILVDISAPWCPTCREQAVVLDELVSEPRFDKLQVFSVDFDSQKELLHKLGVQKQSTLIVFKGASEVGRSVGDTSKPSIEALLTKGL